MELETVDVQRKKGNLEDYVVGRDEPEPSRLRIGFVHYFFDERSAGVNRVIDNNVKGLKKIYKGKYEIDPVLIAGSFQERGFEGYEQRRINLDRAWSKRKRYNNIIKSLEEVTTDLDGIVIENPLRGIDATFTKAVRDFSNKIGKKVVYRNHDFVMDYHDDLGEFLKPFKPFKSMFPKKKVTQSVLTSSTQYKINNVYDGNARVLRNSVVCEDFSKVDEKKNKELRSIFEEKGIVKPGEKIIAYPVRIDQRKNIEEAMMIVKALNEFYGENYRLIVTATRDKDYRDEEEVELDKFYNRVKRFIKKEKRPKVGDKPKSNKYQRRLERLAWKRNIPVSLGEAFEILDGKKFDVSNLYHLSDLAISTAVKEGFGYAYVEPWVAGTAMIGRDIREVREDFVKNGMKFDHLYDSSDIKDGRNWNKRVNRINRILKKKNRPLFKDFVDGLNLMKRIKYAQDNVGENAKAVENAYNHVTVAFDFARILKLPGYKDFPKTA